MALPCRGKGGGFLGFRHQPCPPRGIHSSPPPITTHFSIVTIYRIARSLTSSKVPWAASMVQIPSPATPCFTTAEYSRHEFQRYHLRRPGRAVPERPSRIAITPATCTLYLARRHNLFQVSLIMSLTLCRSEERKAVGFAVDMHSGRSLKIHPGNAAIVLYAVLKVPTTYN